MFALNKVKNLLKWLKIIHLRYKLYAFVLLLFVSSFCLVRSVSGVKKRANLISSFSTLVSEQALWLDRKDEVYEKFDDACEHLKGNKNLGNSLMGFVEEIASEYDYKFELSDEPGRKIDEVSISSVSATFHNISLPDFIYFSDAIIGDGVRISSVDFTAGKDGSLNVRCLVEAVSLDEK
jgi:hypothetical protein